MLLNINTATSALLPPSPLPSFIQHSMPRERNKPLPRFSESAAMGSNAERLLKGVFLRICYDRGPYNNGVDYNTEPKRTVQFQQFGRLAKDQRFWHLKQSGGVRQIDSSKPSQTVQQYFSSSKFLFATKHQFTANSTENVLLKGRYDNDLICVNVGKPVRTRMRHGETLDDLMKEQCLNGAQWIPACLLQIKDNQIVKSPLPSAHVFDMIRKALRLPAANASLIENEGLKILGVNDQPLVRHALACTFYLGKD